MCSLNFARFSFFLKGTLKYQSQLLRYIMTLSQLPFFLFGTREQKQVLSIVLKDGYIENSVFYIWI
jgi:hypothetical protein